MPTQIHQGKDVMSKIVLLIIFLLPAVAQPAWTVKNKGDQASLIVTYNVPPRPNEAALYISCLDGHPIGIAVQHPEYQPAKYRKLGWIRTDRGDAKKLHAHPDSVDGLFLFNTYSLPEWIREFRSGRLAHITLNMNDSDQFTMSFSLMNFTNELEKNCHWHPDYHLLDSSY